MISSIPEINKNEIGHYCKGRITTIHGETLKEAINLFQKFNSHIYILANIFNEKMKKKEIK